MLVKFAIYFSALISLYFLFFNINLNYLYSDFKEYLLVLLAVSSMVFTIMGIWIAFLYPNALQRLMDPDKIENADFSESLTETKRLEGLVASVLKSAFIVTIIMLMFLTKVILFDTHYYTTYIHEIKSAALAFIIILTFLQLESIIFVIFSNVMFINDLHSKREDKEANADI